MPHILRPFQAQALDHAKSHPLCALFLEMRLGKTVVAIRAVKEACQRILVVCPATSCYPWRDELLEEGEQSVALALGSREARRRALQGEQAPEDAQAGPRQRPRGRVQEVVLGPKSVKKALSRPPSSGPLSAGSPAPAPAAPRPPKWVLTNYEGLADYEVKIHPVTGKKKRRAFLRPEIAAVPWDAVILDESDRIKNPQADVTRLCTQNFRDASRRIILAGLPAPEGPLDYCEQFRFLYGNFMGFRDYWSFRLRSHFLADGHYKWVVRPQWRDQIRTYVREHAFVLSRKDVGLANEKIYERRVLEMPADQARRMKRMEEEFLQEQGDGHELETKWVPVKAVWMQQLAGGWVGDQFLFEGKFKALEEEVQGALRDQPIVVWFRFNEELEHAYKRLTALGETCTTLLGSKTPAERDAAVKGFQQGRYRIILAQTKVGLYSLNLSNAGAVIYFSNGFSLRDRQQSEDRAEHITRKDPILLIDLVTKDSPDETTVRVLRRKKAGSDFYMVKELFDDIRRRHEKTSHD